MARSFNGSSDEINISTGVSAPAALSLSFWLNMTALPGATGSIFQRRVTSGTGNPSFYVAISNTGKMSWFFANAVSAVNPGLATITVGTWYHIAATYDSVNGLKTFVNNVSDGTAANNGTLSNDATGNPALGYDTASGGSFLNGLIADVALWNTNLSAGNITSLFNGVRPTSVANANLIGWWPLDGYASPETDLSGNSNTGTLTGTARALGPSALWRISG